MPDNVILLTDLPLRHSRLSFYSKCSPLPCDAKYKPRIQAVNNFDLFSGRKPCILSASKQGALSGLLKGNTLPCHLLGGRREEKKMLPILAEVPKSQTNGGISEGLVSQTAKNILCLIKDHPGIWL